MKIGDIVGRKSYNSDIYFRIEEILDDGTAILCGIKYRLKVQSKINDLEEVSTNRLDEYAENFREDVDKKINTIVKKRTNYMGKKAFLPGKVLHVDADSNYLIMCMNYYNKLAIPAVGEYVSEIEQPDKIEELIHIHKPDILVITGHDSLKSQKDPKDINNYKNSKYFVETVKRARDVNFSKDSLVIIAGACQSYYEELISAGANVSSSPKRIVIHALDPVLVAEKIAYTNIEEVLKIDAIVENTISGVNGMGGFETRGILREGFPEI